jgi:hypothetical protein
MGDEKGDSVVIRVKKPTKELLSNLKLVETETFDSVVNRLLQSKLEEHLELSDATAELLSQRLQQVKKGNALSSKELLRKFQERRKLVRSSI